MKYVKDELISAENNVASEAAQVWRFPPSVLGSSSAAFPNIEKRAAL